MSSEDEKNENYTLSYELLGHSADVRAVRFCSQRDSSAGHCILTASRDGTACVWEPDMSSPREYILRKVVKKHTGFVTALCAIPSIATADGGYSETLFATGGQDNTVLIHSLRPDIETPLRVYVGHQGVVSSIICLAGQLISASWDSTVRVWRDSGDCDVLEAHKPAVWAVAGLFEVDGSRRILSCGADKLIKLWEVDSKMCMQEYRGHADVVRDVKVASPDTFYSASNDCTVRRWNLHNGYCLNEIRGHEAFVYSLTVFPGSGGAEFVSSGEDGTIRIWKGVDCVQVIHVPAVSVWSICCKELNGDIVAGSSDGVARIFSRYKSMVASRKEQEVYDQRVFESRSSSKNTIDVSKYQGPDALLSPGKADGDTKVINNKGVPEVYQWSMDNQQWILIGNAIGKAPEESASQSNVFSGEKYDFVFDIELDEGTPSMKKLKLPYNKTMDPYVAAEIFLETNHLPAYYLDQVAEFIIKNAGEFQGEVAARGGDPFTGGSRYIPGHGSRGLGSSSSGSSDPFTGGSRYQPGSEGGGGAGGGGVTSGGADPFTGSSSYRPGYASSQDNKPSFSVSFKSSPKPNQFFPMTGFKLFTNPQDYCDKVLGKIVEFNSSGAIDEKDRFSPDQLVKLKNLCASLMSSSSLDSYGLSLVELMLNWPSQYAFPGLDLIRLVLIHPDGCGHFIGDVKKGQEFLNTLLLFASDDSQPKNQVPVLRALANLFAQEAGTSVIHIHRKWVLEKLTEYFRTTNRTSQIALSTIILNYCHFYHDVNKDDPEGVMETSRFALKICSSSYDLEAKYRAMMGMGTLLLGEAKSLVLSAVLVADLRAALLPLVSVSDPIKVSQCSGCVLDLLPQ